MIKNKLHTDAGFTLIQLVVVLIGMALLASMALQIVTGTVQQARENQARAEMKAIVEGIIGNPQLRSEEWRIDYGYVGDVGSLPDNLNALIGSNTCGWHGPYVEVNYQEAPDDWKTDPWGTGYVYDKTNMVIKSTGGPKEITVPIARSQSFILNNSYSVRVKNFNGTPFTDDQGTVYAVINPCENIAFQHLDDDEGVWTVSGVPQGRRDFFIATGGDTSYYAVNVEPGRPVPFKEYTIYPEFGVIEYVGGSAALSGTDNHNLAFSVQNVGDPTFFVNRIKISWEENTSQCWGEFTPYLEHVVTGSDTLWSYTSDGGGQRAESGVSFGIDPPIEFPTGQFDFDELSFSSVKTGAGYPVDMRGTRMVVIFYLKNAGSQTVDFLTTSTSCVPGNIQYADSLTTEAGTDTSNLAYYLQNTGNLKVYIKSYRMTWKTTPSFLDYFELNTNVLFEYQTHRVVSGNTVNLGSNLIISPGMSVVNHMDFRDNYDASSAGYANMSGDTVRVAIYTIGNDSFIVRVPLDSSQFH